MPVLHAGFACSAWADLRSDPAKLLSLLLAGATLVLTGCRVEAPDPTAPPALPSLPSPSATLTIGSRQVPHPSHLVVVGTDADHVVITEPLVEVIPDRTADDATLHVSIETQVLLGIEGALGFVRAHTEDGAVVLDRIVELSGDTIEVPPGNYVLLSYYRTCGGSCALLDPEQSFCALEAVLEPSGTYDLNVIVREAGADCTLDRAAA